MNAGGGGRVGEEQSEHSAHFSMIKMGKETGNGDKCCWYDS